MSNSRKEELRYKPADPTNPRGFIMALRMRGVDDAIEYEDVAASLTYPCHFIINPDNDDILVWQAGEAWHRPGKVLRPVMDPKAIDQKITDLKDEIKRLQKLKADLKAEQKISEQPTE